jgi:quercetin dioxygenase-like cupin family protein
MPVSPEIEALLEQSYSAFNARDIDAVFVTMHSEVDWPDMLGNRRIVGHEAVRAYWSGQFEVMDPTVTPTAFSEGADGSVVVDVHQIVRSNDGELLAEHDVQHVYTFRDGLAVAMDVYHDGELASAPRTEPPRVSMPLNELPHTSRFHELVGAEHGDVSFSIILIHCAPGEGPRVHTHPYGEVFVVEQGEATFQLGDRQLVVPSDHVVVSPPNIPHGFTNSGSGELRLVSVHDAPRFETEWLAGPDPEWGSPTSSTEVDDA